MNVKLQKQILSPRFSGAWTPSFFEFMGKFSKIQQNEHTPGYPWSSPKSLETQPQSEDLDENPQGADLIF